MNLGRGLNTDIWKPYLLNLKSGMIENYFRSIWTLGWLRMVFAQYENLESDWKLYLLNLDIEVTKNCIRSIWKSRIWLRTVFAQSGNLEVTKNYICSIWTLGWPRTVFTQSKNLEFNWELYSLNLEIRKPNENYVRSI